jgi:hypothetical protein
VASHYAEALRLLPGRCFRIAADFEPRRRVPFLPNGPLKGMPNTSSVFWQRAESSAASVVANEQSSQFVTSSPTMGKIRCAVGSWQPWGEWWGKIF